ncbi:interferon alpha-inducible protein 27-like protein 2A [Acipenser ruthenus]|uniref:interferon alpha-inducible protein 27-like protein 2A n=1 Tax=Acipenser ruthenus TaxID=7906 RepID=UPI00155F6A10|nr:interferon alpha-inducible protein 27-like protein 2A [Acipenser ruthenus]
MSLKKFATFFIFLICTSFTQGWSWGKQQEAKEEDGWSWKAVAGMGAGAAVALVAAPAVLTAAGFTSAGIAAGSVAAKAMSVAAVSSGGGVVSGGVVATLQSAGAAGMGVAAKTVVGVAGGVLGYLGGKDEKDSQEE